MFEMLTLPVTQLLVLGHASFSSLDVFIECVFGHIPVGYSLDEAGGWQKGTTFSFTFFLYYIAEEQWGIP